MNIPKAAIDVDRKSCEYQEGYAAGYAAGYKDGHAVPVEPTEPTPSILVHTELTDIHEIQLNVTLGKTVMVHFKPSDKHSSEPARVLYTKGDNLYLKRADCFWWYRKNNKHIDKIVLTEWRDK